MPQHPPTRGTQHACTTAAVAARRDLGDAWGRLASDVSAVNTFFYQRLTQTAGKRTRSGEERSGGELGFAAKRAAGYANVRSWSRRRDVFKLKYLFREKLARQACGL